MRRWHLAAVLGLFCWAAAPPAAAFCRTNTCDVEDTNDPDCRTENGCTVGGESLFWPQQCVSFGVQAEASPLREITHDTAVNIIATAFDQWMGATCEGDANPSILLSASPEPVACNEVEFNEEAANANTWIFRDENWPEDTPTGGGQGISASTLALTTITFNADTGEIFDADVEINSRDAELTTANENVVIDLASIVTHEAGHFLGLSHSTQRSATMFSDYTPGSISLRELDADDEAGICAAYPPGRRVGACDFEPINGFSPECGQDQGCSCELGPGRTSRRTGYGLLAVMLAFALMASRRRAASRTFD